MANYDFSTLSPIDFEKLVCDLLNAKLNNLNKTKFYDYFIFDYEYIRQRDWQTVVFQNSIEANKKSVIEEEDELHADFDY